MRKTLEAFYFGNITPNERGVDKRSKYWQVSKKAQKAHEEIREVLNEKELELFDKFVALEISSYAELELDAYITGFRTGVRLLIDSLVDNDFAGGEE